MNSNNFDKIDINDEIVDFEEVTDEVIVEDEEVIDEVIIEDEEVDEYEAIYHETFEKVKDDDNVISLFKDIDKIIYNLITYNFNEYKRWKVWIPSEIELKKTILLLEKLFNYFKEFINREKIDINYDIDKIEDIPKRINDIKYTTGISIITSLYKLYDNKFRNLPFIKEYNNLYISNMMSDKTFKVIYDSSINNDSDDKGDDNEYFGYITIYSKETGFNEVFFKNFIKSRKYWSNEFKAI